MFDITTPPEYESQYLETQKCRPFIDRHHILLIRNVINRVDYDWNCFDDSQLDMKKLINQFNLSA